KYEVPLVSIDFHQTVFALGNEADIFLIASFYHLLIHNLSLQTQTDRPLLCSVCKEGTMKFWDITTSRRFKLVEEMPKAHSESIYSVCSNKYMVFTASSDQTIGFWKLSVQD
ncbi:hypothetical protein COOONC_14229, partial [Cooperia oncophora]